jgi:hypothetical protein
MIGPKPYLYFIHVPKTAGSYVSRFLQSELGEAFVREGHTVPPDALRPWTERFGPCHYASVKRELCFTFAVVRNPFSLLVSMYLFGFPYWSRKDYAGKGQWPFKSFRDYVMKLCVWTDYPWICPQQKESLFFQLYDGNGRYFADAILRQEAIEDGLKALGHALGSDWHPPSEPVNTGRGYSYADFYDRDMAKAVATRYALDFERFGYDFASHDGRVLLWGSDCHGRQTRPDQSAADLKVPALSGRLADVDFHACHEAILWSCSGADIARHLLHRIGRRLSRALVPGSSR